uniref:HSF_DOMAIN domain-containing protein n=1 Tax=Trichobilharzia regenti TaxID=157069 RepID=A0AA85JAV3_TRIRE|nr:unnamed protein product [Trichobilharzia regenti]
MYQSHNTHNSHYCQQYSMGNNCSLCKNENYRNDYLQSVNDTSSEDSTFQNMYMSNSLSYPLLNREYHHPLNMNNNHNNINPDNNNNNNMTSGDVTESDSSYNYDTTVLLDTIRDFGWPFFEKSTSAFSLHSHARSNFSSSYRDCRLRYIKQTRKLQKYLRITPEGHILVNNPKIEHYPSTQQQLPSNHTYNNSTINTLESKDHLNKITTSTTTNGHELYNNPFGSLISTPRIKRIYTAFWNLEPRESISLRRLHTSSSTQFPVSRIPMTQEESGSLFQPVANGTSPDHCMNGCEHSNGDESEDELELKMHNILSSNTHLEPVMEKSFCDSSTTPPPPPLTTTTTNNSSQSDNTVNGLSEGDTNSK